MDFYLLWLFIGWSHHLLRERAGLFLLEMWSRLPPSFYLFPCHRADLFSMTISVDDMSSLATVIEKLQMLRTIFIERIPVYIFGWKIGVTI